MKSQIHVNNEGKLKCAIEYTLNKIGDKWKTVILWHLSVEGPYRYNELRRLLPGVSHKVLTQQLKELEEDGLINREQFNEVPPKVVYSMKDLGMSLKPVLDEMHRWGTTYGEDFQ